MEKEMEREKNMVGEAIQNLKENLKMEKDMDKEKDLMNMVI